MSKEIPNAQERALIKAGVDFEYVDSPWLDAEGNAVCDETGTPRMKRTLRIKSAPGNRINTIMSVLSSTTPCWFPECEEIRKNYNAEIAELEEDCPSCKRGKIIRKYIETITKLLYPDNV